LRIRCAILRARSRSMILSTLSFLSATIFHGVAKTDLPPSRRSAAL
jgi:hypothetical protein